MRKIIVFENVSLDNFIAGPKGEIDWAIRDDEITEFNKHGQDTIDMFLFGHTTYNMMASFWPTPMGKAANPIFADILNKASKIVFSKTLKNADWENTEIVKDLTKEEIMKLKNRPGKNMMIFGSGTIVGQLTELGLIDEYQLMINPVILGYGKPLFKDLKDKINLKLVNSHVFKNGVVLLQYEPQT